jgi:membrane protein
MARRRGKTRTWLGLSREMFESWGRADAAAQSAALAFYTIFSLAPILVVVIALAGSIWGEEAVRGQIFGQFRGMMGDEAALLVQEVLQSAGKPATRGWAMVIGLGTLLFGATGVFVQLQDSLNAVWEVTPKPGAVVKRLLRKRLLSFTLVISLGFLLMVSLIASAALAAFTGYLQRILTIPVAALEVTNLALSFAMVTLLFTLIYRLLPDVKLDWRDVWLGAAVTAALFVVGKGLIGLYLGRTGVASAYGAAGSLVVVLSWVYYSALIFFFGAIFTRVHSRQFRDGRAEAEPGAVRLPPGTAKNTAAAAKSGAVAR